MFDRFKKRFDSKGIAVIPFVFSSQECDEIKRQAYEVTDEQIKSSGYPHVPSEQAFNKKSLIFFCFKRLHSTGKTSSHICYNIFFTFSMPPSMDLD